jgi:type I restriction enzyme S subunit
MAFGASLTEIVARNENGLLGKHASWKRIRLGDVATVQNGFAFRSAHFNRDGAGMPLLRIRDVLPGTTDTFYDGPYDEAFIVRPGDLVIGMDGDFNHTLWPGPPALLNQRVCRLRFHADVLELDFLSWILGGYLRAVNAATSSVTVKHLSSRTVADLMLPLPPPDAQVAIVQALDRTIGQVRSGRKHFTQALDDAGRYRVAALLAAFEQATETRPLGELAEVQSGMTKGRRAEDDARSVPYVRTANVQAGFLDLAEMKEISATPRQVARHSLRVDDVLILEGGDADKVGRGWIWEGQIEPCLHQNHVFAVRADRERLLPRFLAHFVNSPLARRYFLSCAKQTTNLASINKRQLTALPVPVMSRDEQIAAIARVEASFDAAQALERDLHARLADSRRLEQTLLSAAVDGRLATAVGATA